MKYASPGRGKGKAWIICLHDLCFPRTELVSIRQAVAEWWLGTGHHCQMKWHCSKTLEDSSRSECAWISDKSKLAREHSEGDQQYHFYPALEKAPETEDTAPQWSSSLAWSLGFNPTTQTNRVKCFSVLLGIMVTPPEFLATVILTARATGYSQCHISHGWNQSCSKAMFLKELEF